MRNTLVLSLLAVTVALGQSALTPMKLGDVTVTGTLRLRAYGWDWFEPTSGDNAYAYSGNILRLNFAEKRKGWDWDAELAAPFLLGMPDNATAPAPQGALGLGSNYYSANGNSPQVAMSKGSLMRGAFESGLMRLSARQKHPVILRWR